jgi:Icc-related predicted phosphoesterase
MGEKTQSIYDTPFYLPKVNSPKLDQFYSANKESPVILEKRKWAIGQFKEGNEKYREKLDGILYITDLHGDNKTLKTLFDNEKTDPPQTVIMVGDVMGGGSEITSKVQKPFYDLINPYKALIKEKGKNNLGDDDILNMEIGNIPLKQAFIEMKKMHMEMADYDPKKIEDELQKYQNDQSVLSEIKQYIHLSHSGNFFSTFLPPELVVKIDESIKKNADETLEIIGDFRREVISQGKDMRIILNVGNAYQPTAYDPNRPTEDVLDINKINTAISDKYFAKNGDVELVENSRSFETPKTLQIVIPYNDLINGIREIDKEKILNEVVGAKNKNKKIIIVGHGVPVVKVVSKNYGINGTSADQKSLSIEKNFGELIKTLKPDEVVTSHAHNLLSLDPNKSEPADTKFFMRVEDNQIKLVDNINDWKEGDILVSYLPIGYKGVLNESSLKKKIIKVTN